MMTMLYKVAGIVTLNAEDWESDPCLKLHIDTKEDVSLLHCHSNTVRTLKAPVHIPLLLFLRWTLAQWKPFHATTLQKIVCHFSVLQVKA